jgi:hypothetical protein
MHFVCSFEGTEQILLYNDDSVLTPGTDALLREYVQV